MIQNILTDMSLFVDGKGYAGKCPELTLPKITPKMREYRGGGMSGTVEIPTGSVEKMEAEFTLSGIEPDVLALLRILPGEQAPLTIRGALVDYDGTETPVLVALRGQIKTVDMGTWKPGDESPLKISMAVSYYRLEHGSRVLYEIDPVNMVMTIDGVDRLAQTRANIGL
ncbi:phage major tail tube protein [Thiomicrorhabdus sp.]|uniref:phage major tail tube protein n=1 Tax=Thiomicrorhabdus sp. TaxID=2039724 RepID=UPI0029C7ECA5|nr:phage major tail tube protein [Thiomicrorhabdus sp.]